jgi:hypothetical protein
LSLNGCWYTIIIPWTASWNCWECSRRVKWILGLWYGCLGLSNVEWLYRIPSYWYICSYKAFDWLSIVGLVVVWWMTTVDSRVRVDVVEVTVVVMRNATQPQLWNKHDQRQSQTLSSNIHYTYTNLCNS